MPTSHTPQDFAGHSILVVGEAILDCYQEGTVSRISREAPVPVLSSVKILHRCGGAANTAANVTAMGSEATMVSLVGTDQAGEKLREQCERAGITLSLVEKDIATPTKTRILADRQQLLRIDECQSQREHAKALAKAAINALPGHDVLVISDYGLGALEQAASIIDAARKAHIPVVVDPRGKDWSRYRGADLVTPNLEELALADGTTATTSEQRAQELMERHEIGIVLLTSGPAGMTIFSSGSKPIELSTRVVDVYDVTGAGDTVAAMMALGLAAGTELSEAARWSNMAAGIVVGKFGTAVATPEELMSEPGGHGGQVVEIDSLLAQLDVHRKAGRKIVMTNGCFDIMHAGHLETLSAAARLGDLLVVCVNDDDSVAKLKGPNRPVVPIGERLQVLAGLGCVDYALPFSGVDAAGLVRMIVPDTFVKGGDWEGENPPEAAVAKELGANVVYLGLRPRLSTTEIIRKIREDDS